jgi:hypothetical protein
MGTVGYSRATDPTPPASQREPTSLHEKQVSRSYHARPRQGRLKTFPNTNSHGRRFEERPHGAELVAIVVAMLLASTALQA